MKNTVPFALASAAVLALAGCGSSDKASEDAQAENVEMPAEEALGGVDASAAPASDAAAVPGAEATAPASEAASGAPADGASAAAEKATTDAEKKM